MAFRSAKTASKVMPTRRNGKEISHTSGKTINASNANGHAKTKRINHPTNNNRTFIFY